MKTMTKIVGSDIDGVLATNENDVRDFRPWRLHQWYSLCEPTERCGKYYDFIVTGRRIHYQKLTKRWLKENNVECGELVMFPNKTKKTNRSLAEYKAKVINDIGIDVFYEDDVRIFGYLIDNCPDVEIHLIQNIKI